MRSRAEIHPDMYPLLDARASTGKPNTIAERREAWARYAAILSSAPPPADMRVEDRAIPSSDTMVPVRIYWPSGAPNPSPVFVYMHGGGFVLGDLDTSGQFAWGMADKAGLVVVSVDYRLAPEHPFPAPFDDCYAVLCWLAEHGAAIGIDPARIYVGGESAGGSLALALCLASRDRHGPVIAGQMLIYPSTGENPSLPSYRENEHGPSLTTAAVISNHALYWNGEEYAHHPYAAPATAKDLSGLPPCWIHTAEFDPVRDDGRVLASKLAMLGRTVAYREAKRMLHGFTRVRLSGTAAAMEFDMMAQWLRAAHESASATAQPE